MLEIDNQHCFHCSEPIVDKGFTQELLDAERHFCCPGCEAVACSIIDNGLEDYYQYRTAPAEKSDLVPDKLANMHALYDAPELQSEFVSSNQDIEEVQLTLEGINCPACGWLIERQLSQVDAVKQVGVNVSARRATIRWAKQALPLSKLLQKIEEIGYHARPFSPDQHERLYQQEHKSFLKKLGLSGLMTMQVMMLAFGLYFGVFGSLDEETKNFFHWVSFVLTTPVVFYSASVFIVSALNGLAARHLNMDLPISIAIVTTYLASAWATITEYGPVYFESICMFVFLLLIGRYFEHNGREKALEISNNASNMVPVMARLIEAEEEHEVPAKVLKPGQLHRVLTGEMFPVDGVVESGTTQADEAIITGESMPVAKSTGSKVLGGSLNVGNPVTVKTEHALKDSAIKQIVKLQELALSAKPDIALIADRFASYFVAAVLVIAASTFVYWHLHSPEDALWITTSVLIATCPCALGLATPSAFTCAMAKLNQLGFVVKRSDVLENINEIDVIALDKTGTLTVGQPSIATWQNYSQWGDDHVLGIASALEKASEHPIAAAFIKKSEFVAENHQVITGAGVEAEIDGITYRIGSHRFVAQWLGNSAPGAGFNNKHDVFLAKSNGSSTELLAGFNLQDDLKPGVKALLASLDATPVILSGDNEAKVAHTAQQLGIKQYFAELSPDAKLAKLNEMQRDYKVMMVGDGVNDAPVLAQADVSVAVNEASDFAQSSADIVMLNTQVNRLNDLFALSGRTVNKVRQNIAWAISYNLLVLPFAVTGLLAPWAAAIGMSLSSVIVTYNSIRLIKTKGETSSS